MKRFTPTKEQIRAAEAVFTAMAHEGVIRPIVEAYQLAILDKHQFRISKKWVDMGCEDKLILKRNESYLLADEDWSVYNAECFAARDAANLKVDDPEHCPLLVAKDIRTQAQQVLLMAISTTPGLESLGKATSLSMDNYKKAVDLSLKMLAPFCGKADDILGRYMAKVA